MCELVLVTGETDRSSSEPQLQENTAASSPTRSDVEGSAVPVGEETGLLHINQT